MTTSVGLAITGLGDSDAAVAPAHTKTITPPSRSRVLLIASNASRRFGGEAVLPLHYFGRLHALGVDAWLITNQRNEAELRELLSSDQLAFVRFVPDGPFVRACGRLWEKLPARFANFTIGQVLELLDQSRAAALARQLIQQGEVSIVHQVTPVSPRHVSVIRRLGVPVIMGPMNGGMSYPRGFAGRERLIDRLFMNVGKHFANVMNRLMPGKREAQVLMVANERTRRALPQGCRGEVVLMPENGVDLGVWRPQHERAAAGDGATHFAFAGRLVDWKGVDLLLRAAAIARDEADIRVDIAGDGPWRGKLECMSRELGLEKLVTFHGWLSHAACAQMLARADAMVLPSLCECGGAVVLEAMAMKLPVIATDWGGPADYLDERCGILVEPRDEQQFIRDLAAAMVKLANTPALRIAMGEAGYEKVCAHYDWPRKVSWMCEVYESQLAAARVACAS